MRHSLLDPPERGALVTVESTTKEMGRKDEGEEGEDKCWRAVQSKRQRKRK